MRDGEPGWFYVGNGQLRYKDTDGWTDQYQDIDGPAKTSDVGPSASPDVLGSGIAEAGRGARDPSSLTRFCSSAAHYLIVGFSRLMVVLWRLIVGLRGLMVVLWRRLIVGLRGLMVVLWRLIVGLRGLMVVLWRLIAEKYRQASASYASRSVAGRLRGPSRSSVLVGRLIGLMKRSWLAHPRPEIVRHWSSFRLGPQEGEECPEFVLDPVRLQDLLGGVVGVDQRDPHPGKVMGAQPPMDG